MKDHDHAAASVATLRAELAALRPRLETVGHERDVFRRVAAGLYGWMALYSRLPGGTAGELVAELARGVSEVPTEAMVAAVRKAAGLDT